MTHSTIQQQPQNLEGAALKHPAAHQKADFQEGETVPQTLIPGVSHGNLARPMMDPKKWLKQNERKQNARARS